MAGETGFGQNGVISKETGQGDSLHCCDERERADSQSL
jgi:hypothetical protein